MSELAQPISARSSVPAAISVDEAFGLIRTTHGPAWASLLRRANETRDAVFGTAIGLCAIVNAKWGGCSEDCAFCSQSRRVSDSCAPVPAQPLLPAARLSEAASWAEASGASAFSMVTAGRLLAGESEYVELANALADLRRTTGLLRCASLGLLQEPDLRRLRAAGLQRYHCNLETAPSFFPRVCTSHSFDDKLKTLGAAQKLGLSLCSGGIFGMGETPEQRVELAGILSELQVDAIPINFLDPRPGTPLASAALLSPEACLTTIAVFRLMVPRAELIVMGGREVQLRGMQDEIFRAGATGTLVGDYLTTRGSTAEDTIALIEGQGLSVRRVGRNTVGGSQLARLNQSR